MDFTALSSSSAAGNGSYSIDGYTWTVENYANADSIGVVAGTGLVIDPNATASDYNGSTRTSPLLWIPVSSLISDYDYTEDSIRLWVDITGTNQDANYEIVKVALMRGNSWAYANQLAFEAQRLYVNTLYRSFGSRYVGETYAGTSLSSGDMAQVIEMERGGLTVRYYYGSFVSGNWPAASDMTLDSVLNIYAVKTSVSAPIIAANTHLCIEFAAYPVNTSNALTGVLRKMRLQRRKGR